MELLFGTANIHSYDCWSFM